MPDERDVVIRNLRCHLKWVRARAHATLEDMKGKDAMGQLADAKECLERFAEEFDPEPTPQQRKKWGLDPRPSLKAVG